MENSPPIFLVAFFVLFFAVGFGLTGYALSALWQSKAAERWPTVSGRIIASNFDINRDDDSTSYRTDVEYEYVVNGLELTGKRIAFGYTGSSGKRFHRDVYEMLQPDTTVAVRYHPDNPTRAVLTYGPNRSIIVLLIFGMVWTIFIGGMAAMFYMDGLGAGPLTQNMIIYDRP